MDGALYDVRRIYSWAAKKNSPGNSSSPAWGVWPSRVQARSRSAAAGAQREEGGQRRQQQQVQQRRAHKLGEDDRLQRVDEAEAELGNVVRQHGGKPGYGGRVSQRQAAHAVQREHARAGGHSFAAGAEAGKGELNHAQEGKIRGKAPWA